MRRPLVLTLSAVLLAPGTAAAAVPHTVGPGETLWSIAAANNFTTPSIAAFNGLAPDANVVLGSTIMIPSEGEALAANPNPSAAVTGAVAESAAPAADGAAPPPAGAYTVRPGDSFSSLAARTGARPEQVASVNGLDVDAPLIAGTAIKLPPATEVARQPDPAPTSTPAVETPAATPGRVTSDDIHRVAGEQGVDGSLASAIAWQESGFNNAMVSSANARGVMQVMPGTWDWVQENLAERPLDPSSATDNVEAGALYLGQLLRDTGGDERLAAAGYYQGLASVREIGMLPETERYVDNVMALKGRFGG
jgi:soluble lytic murein transglycosylase-like protein